MARLILLLLDIFHLEIRYFSKCLAARLMLPDLLQILNTASQSLGLPDEGRLPFLL